MARPLRLEFAGGLYHVTSRGDRREDIFAGTRIDSPGVTFLLTCAAMYLKATHPCFDWSLPDRKDICADLSGRGPPAWRALAPEDRPMATLYRIDPLFQQCYYSLYNVVLWRDAMLAVRLDSDLESKLEALAQAKRSSKSELVREAIVRFLEDEEDADLAARALAKTKSPKPLAKLRKELGLDR